LESKIVIFKSIYQGNNNMIFNTVLITGGAGAIGYTLVRTLLEKANKKEIAIEN